MAACDAATLEVNVKASGYAKLSARDLLMCLAYVYGNRAGLTATTAISGAKAAGYAKISDADLKKCYETLIC